MITGRADEAARPSQPFQVVQAICISREPSPKLPKRLRVVNAGMGTFHCPSLAQLRLNGYPRVVFRREADVRFAEIDLFGVYVAPISLMMVAAGGILVVLRHFSDR